MELDLYNILTCSDNNVEDGLLQLRAFLSENPDVNLDELTSSSDGETALQLASQQRSRCPMIRILVQHNADVNAQNIHGRTALMDAAIYGNVDGVHSLLENGADHSLTDNSGFTAFHYALIYNRNNMGVQCEMLNVFMSTYSSQQLFLSSQATISTGFQAQTLSQMMIRRGINIKTLTSTYRDCSATKTSSKFQKFQSSLWMMSNCWCRIEVLAVLYLFTGVRVTGMFEKQGFPSIWDDSLSQFLRNFEEDCIFTKDTHFSYPSVHLVEKRYADIETLSVHSNKVNVQYFRNVYQYKTILFKAKERPRFSSIQHTLEIFAARVRKLKHILEAFGVSLYNTISTTVTSARETIKELKDIIAEQNIQIQAGRSLHDLGIAVSITYPGSDLHSAEKSPKGLGRLSIYSITAFIWSSLKWERTLQCIPLLLLIILTVCYVVAEKNSQTNHKDPGIPSSDEVFLQRWTESVSDEDFAEINLKMWQNTLGNAFADDCEERLRDSLPLDWQYCEDASRVEEYIIAHTEEARTQAKSCVKAWQSNKGGPSLLRMRNAILDVQEYELHNNFDFREYIDVSVLNKANG